MQLVKQTLVTTKDLKQFQVCRWDNIKKVLMFQNRSKDTEMSLEDYLNRLNTTITQAKAKGLLVAVRDVPIGSNWPTAKTLKQHINSKG